MQVRTELCYVDSQIKTSRNLDIMALFHISSQPNPYPSQYLGKMGFRVNQKSWRMKDLVATLRRIRSCPCLLRSCVSKLRGDMVVSGSEEGFVNMGSRGLGGLGRSEFGSVSFG